LVGVFEVPSSLRKNSYVLKLVIAHRNLTYHLLGCQELLSQYCGVHTYILALAELSSSSSDIDNRLRRLHPILLLFLVLDYLPLAHNLNIGTFII
jgi:hypothetical protein